MNGSSSRRGARVCLLAAIVAAIALLIGSSGRAASPVLYRFSFPEVAHRWMQVEAAFLDLDAAPLELRMSRSSPGRYTIHDFAKNVYDVEAIDAEGRALAIERPDPHGWTVPAHGSSVTVRYKVFGDRVDGTYLGIDPTHAHINMPAAILWARGMDDRPATLRFTPPSGANWQIATQLHPGATPFEFAAPNLQYLMDSPVEFGPVSIRQFAVDGATFRFAAHHTGTGAELDSLVRDVERIVREERTIFGEYPAYDSGSYTFLADYLPYAVSDGMEHRNSTVMTLNGSIRDNRADLLDTVAHEFFHGWNVERIRPRSLEPFDLERANMSGELWLAEGFTQYYGPLVLARAGLADLQATAAVMGGFISGVADSPGRMFRSPVEMSRMAPFTDLGRPLDRTNWSNTVISYYTDGGALALALDLSLRGRSDGRVTLDDFMRAMWRVHGKPGGSRQGYVDHPYTLDDAERRLADVSGDAGFARDFFARYVHGRELPDYAALLARAGLTLRRPNARLAWWGDIRLAERDGLRVVAPPGANTPAYAAGLDVDDEVRRLDGARVTSPDDVAAVLRRHAPGDTVAVEFVDRAGVTQRQQVVLAGNPGVEVVLMESAGGTPSAAQRAFRQAWMGAR